MRGNPVGRRPVPSHPLGDRDTIVVITNGRQQTAHAARTEFAKLESLVQQIRAESESEEETESPSDEGQPIKLRLFR